MSFDETKHLVQLSISEMQELRKGLNLVISKSLPNRDYSADALWNRLGDEIRGAEKIEADL